VTGGPPLDFDAPHDERYPVAGERREGTVEQLLRREL
jgi:hypothetical protein